MRRISLLLSIFVLNAFASLEISIDQNVKKLFYIGEKVYIPVYIQETGALYDAGGSNHQGTDGYYLINDSDNASWLKEEGRPEYADGHALNTSDPNNHWQNNQAFWIQLSGFAPRTGSYSGTLTVKKGLESASLKYSFRVSEYPIKTPAIISYDSAASYHKQIDLHSYIRNNSDKNQTLKQPYMDYYLTKTIDQQAVLNIWKKPVNSCVQILDCGNDNFVIRQKFLGDQTLKPGQESDEFLLGYNEWSKPSNSYYFSALQEKDLSKFYDKGYNPESETNSYVDYSYAGWATNYFSKAIHRNRFYNSMMALFEKNGSLVFGSSPAWFNSSSCREVYPTTEKKLNYSKVRTDDLKAFCGSVDVIYEGEDYFSKIYVDENSKKTYSLGDGSYNWFEIGTPADYWDDYKNVLNNNVSGYRDVVYIRSKHNDIRQQNNLYPETIEFMLDATDSFGNTESISKTIVIKDGSEHPSATNSGLAVLLGDETWFKIYQLDIATGIVNYSDKDITLENFYYDYYGSVDVATPTHSANQPHFWYPKLGKEADDLRITETYTDCGNNRFRVRYKYNGQKTLYSNSSYFDNKVGFYYESSIVYNKADDYSMQDFVGEDLNRRRYAPHMPLYDGNGTLLWGQAPSWANQCVDNPILENSSSSKIEVEYSSSSSVPPVVSSSSRIPPSRSSSSFMEIANKLEARFVDERHDVNSILMIKMDVKNNDTKAVDLSGYELRFYYSTTSLMNDASLLVGEVQNSSIASLSTKRCAADLYVVSAKFASNTNLAPGAATSEIRYSMKLPAEDEKPWEGLLFGKKEFASYLDLDRNDNSLKKNEKMALFNKKGKLVFGTPAWECEGYKEKELKLSVKEKIKYVDQLEKNKIKGKTGNITLTIKNEGDSAVVGPVYIDYAVSHPAGQVPVIAIGKDTLAVAGSIMATADNSLKVSRVSSGNKHVFRFVLDEGIAKAKFSRQFSFKLFDQCLLDCVGDDDKTILTEWASQYSWNFADDWSALNLKLDTEAKTENVAIYNSNLELIYGKTDPNVPVLATPQKEVKDSVVLKHSFTEIAQQRPNRTDAVSYSGGQILSGGDFETPWLQGWNVSGDVISVRNDAPQGSRYVQLNAGSRISQKIAPSAKQILADSGATIIVWHKGDYTEISLNNQNLYSNPLHYTSTWKRDTLYIDSSFWLLEKNVDSLSIRANGSLALDDMVLIPGKRAFPSTYAVRFTTTQHEELETRAYDGDKELLVTNSVRDSLGRSWKKFLPFALPCSNPLICNSEMKTLRNQEMANQYYTSDNPDYPDAGGYAYAETKWKPDQSATKDVVGAPGTSYSIASGHLVRAFSSGVNLSDVDLLDSSELSNAVSAVANALLYDSSQKNYHAKKDDNPTHVWSMNEDQDGRRSFSVVDGEGHTIVSGSLGKDGNMLTRSVNILDERGNVIESHSPMSCSFKPVPVGCVTSSKFWYDSESRVVKSEEPDAGVTYTYYDFAGRVRATQTQNQIDSGKVSVVGYDYLDRTEYTGLWLNAGDRDSLTRYFADTNHKKSPTVDELVVGTVTRSFYNRVPFRDTLGVELFPAKIDSANVFKYSRGRLVATISDIGDDESGKPLRISNSISYDKYGRVLKTFSYDASMTLDSLKMMTSENVYDQGGKVVTNAIYPYGLNEGALTRKITNRYSYDLLGRVDTLFSTNGAGKEFVLAAYSYYPTGSVKKIVLGNSIEISYTYHISGAVRTASAVKLPGRDNLYYEEMYYDDCGGIGCTAQYNGNISRVFHDLAHGSDKFPEVRDVAYYYDELNRLVNADDEKSDFFDEKFKYDPQGRIVMQRRGANMDVLRIGGDYVYYDSTNKLARVYGHMSLDNSGNSRDMSADSNFVYDSEGNLIEDKSKNLKISYDWRGMPVEFRMETRAGNVLENTRSCSRDSVRVLMAYDGSGRRVSKTRFRKACISETSTGATSERTYAADWERELVTHYTGIGTEVRENYRNNALEKTKVVVNMPNGLGRYGVEDAEKPSSGNATFEWYLKNHLGSTMLVYSTQGSSNADVADLGEVKKAYDYRSFGEQIDLIADAGDKVTENFTGKEKDDETELNYFGARYLDPMLGLWISVDPARQFSSPYLYAGNGVNPIGAIDPDGTVVHVKKNGNNINYTMYVNFTGDVNEKNINTFVNSVESFYTRKVGNRNISMKVVVDPELAENTIVFIDKKGQSISSRTFGDNYNKNYNEATIFMLNDGNGMKSSIHEAGHLMGMKDRYVKINGVNVVDEGYEGNMMGDKGDGLHPIQIDETLQKKGNTYENFDPYNGD